MHKEGRERKQARQNTEKMTNEALSGRYRAKDDKRIKQKGERERERERAVPRQMPR